MPRRRRKVVGTTAGKSFARPECSQGHDPKYMRREKEGWVCLECADAWLNDVQGITRGKSRGGVILPSGAAVDKQRSFLEIMPNRAARRRAR